MCHFIIIADTRCTSTETFRQFLVNPLELFHILCIHPADVPFRNRQICMQQCFHKTHIPALPLTVVRLENAGNLLMSVCNQIFRSDPPCLFIIHADVGHIQFRIKAVEKQDRYTSGTQTTIIFEIRIRQSAHNSLHKQRISASFFQQADQQAALCLHMVVRKHDTCPISVCFQSTYHGFQNPRENISVHVRAYDCYCFGQLCRLFLTVCTFISHVRPASLNTLQKPFFHQDI